jgi:antitoxin component YwqK of YwqJK toxin-antitoxin module
MKKILMILIGVALFSCTKTFEEKDLDFKNGHYYFPGTEKLFSGTCIHKYTKDGGEGGYVCKDNKDYIIPAGHSTSLEAEFICKDGQVVKSIQYYEDGGLHEVINYKDGVRDGEHIKYCSNDKRQSTTYYKDGKEIIPDGKHDEYGRYNYRLEAELNYKNGKENGKQTYYYDNGPIKIHIMVKDGELDGKSIYYFENGLISKEENYKDGKLDGEYIEYFEKSGNKFIVGNYKDGNKDGKWTTYFKDGKVYQLEDYKDGAFLGYN